MHEAMRLLQGSNLLFALLQGAGALRNPRMIARRTLCISRARAGLFDRQFGISVQPFMDLGMAIGKSECATSEMERPDDVTPGGVEAGVHLEKTVINGIRTFIQEYEGC